METCCEGKATKPTVTLPPILSPISILVRERNWTYVNPEVSKAMIRSLRHDPSIPREDDGAERIYDIIEKFKAKFDGTSRWPINDWIVWQREVDQRKGFNIS